ncbi:MAG: glutamate synthase subunit beta [Parafannyhessea sp.]|uniref:glutamate synthase subunit beta n=1 Tax=Parafannyhessea sp. TaxID=2847324 RepID=UPI003F0B50F8
MGKVGGFLEQSRHEHGMRPIEERVHDYDDLSVTLPEDELRAQAGRCMYCGVAFCQTGVNFGKARTSGCPLHNLIPEWNDLIWRGLWDDAAERLALTNPLPEFTGRVCPALCEAACNLGLHDDPTTIRDDERAISDWQWEHGGPKPLEPAPKGAPLVTVVGTGPSGLACAWELARRGLRVRMVEKSDRPGGLLMYGIPNMKLPKDVVERRADLMRRSGIQIECGVDASDPKVAAKLAKTSDAVVLAAGTGRARTLRVPGADKDGVHLAVEYLTAQTKAFLDGTTSPISAEGKDVVVIGGGDTGTDCVATALRQGAKSIMQLEFLPEPPEQPAPGNAWPEWPAVKKTDYGQQEAIATFGEDRRLWATDTLEVLGDAAAEGLKIVSLDWTSGKPVRRDDTVRTLPAQLVVLAMGFLGPDTGLVEAFGGEVAQQGRPLPVTVGKRHVLAGSKDGRVYCAGDTRNGSTIVVNAISDGLACAAEVASDLLG